MHSFSPDGKHVVLCDGFGLTRLTFPKQLKTDKIVGHWMSANDGLVFAYHAPTNARVGRTVPELKPVSLEANYELSHGAAAPLDAENALTIDDTTLTVLALKGGAKRQHELDGLAVDHGSLDLGPQLAQSSEKVVSAGSGGRFATWNLQTGQLFVGHFPDATKPPVDVLLFQAGAPQGTLQLRAVDGGWFVSAFHVSQGKAWCAFIDQAGQVVSRVVATLTAVAGTGRFFVSQPDAGTVLREPITGTRSEPFALKMPGALAELMAHGDSIWALASDHESFVDVVAGTVLDRKLPAADKEARAGLRAFVAPYQDAGRSANLTIFPWFRPTKDRSEQGYPYNAGDGGLLRGLVMGNLFVRCRSVDDGRWRVGSFSNPTWMRAVGVDEVRAALVAADEHKLGLLSGLSQLSSALSGEFEKGHRVFSDDASGLLLAAIIASSKGAATVADVRAPASLTAQEFLEALDPRVEAEGWREAQTTVLWIVVDRFGAEAAPIVIDWLLTRPSSLARSNSHILADPIKRMTRRFPATARAFAAAADEAEKQGNTAVAMSVRFQLP